MLFICFIVFFHTLVLNFNDTKTLIFNKVAALFLFITILVYIGSRPINGIFIDMTTYVHIFERYKYGLFEINDDIGFSYFILFCTKVMTVQWFFFISACIYIVPLYSACKRWFPDYYFFAFLLFVGSFSFFPYGVNGIRNGMATSLFILAISYCGKNFYWMLFYLALSISFHTSLLLPMVAFLLTFYLTDSKKYVFIWVLSIFLSISMGEIWTELFAGVGFGDDRFNEYLTADYGHSGGFRYDFLIYSAIPMGLALYFKFKKGFNDVTYDRILHTYMITNAFWIMIIRANYSNRFAYLSWFLMAVVVIYPLLKGNLWTRQFIKTGVVILLYYGFTYGMFLYYDFELNK
ncbi:EpsG family protein [Gaetbulibacter sp. M235]|uniref:EpsG family protein n=1 Tax=Gaetbulibacter sp. M235 TaxID=3126510 RepID=UPI00374EA6BF